MLRGSKSPVNQESWPSIGSSGGMSSSSVWPRRRQPSISHEFVDSDNESVFSPPARPSFNIGEAIQLAASLEKGIHSPTNVACHVKINSHWAEVNPYTPPTTFFQILNYHPNNFNLIKKLDYHNLWSFLTYQGFSKTILHSPNTVNA